MLTRLTVRLMAAYGLLCLGVLIWALVGFLLPMLISTANTAAVLLAIAIVVVVPLPLFLAGRFLVCRLIYPQYHEENPN